MSGICVALLLMYQDIHAYINCPAGDGITTSKDVCDICFPAGDVSRFPWMSGLFAVLC